MPSVTELLRQVAIFKDLDDGELARVAEVCRVQEFLSGEHIFKEGEAGNRLYLIVEGDVRISRDVPGSGEEALAVLKPGALFGEMSVFDRSERSTDAISNGGTKCLTITRSDFELCSISIASSRTRCCGRACGCCLGACVRRTTLSVRSSRCRFLVREPLATHETLVRSSEPRESLAGTETNYGSLGFFYTSHG